MQRQESPRMKSISRMVQRCPTKVTAKINSAARLIKYALPAAWVTPLKLGRMAGEGSCAIFIYIKFSATQKNRRSYLDPTQIARLIESLKGRRQEDIGKFTSDRHLLTVTMRSILYLVLSTMVLFTCASAIEISGKCIFDSSRFEISRVGKAE